MYDVADSILNQKIAQIPGVGVVNIQGSSRPAVRVLINPTSLTKFDIGWEQIDDAHGGQCESAERPIVRRTTHLADGHERSTFQGGGVQASDCEFQERRSRTYVGY